MKKVLREIVVAVKLEFWWNGNERINIKATNFPFWIMSGILLNFTFKRIYDWIHFEWRLSIFLHFWTHFKDLKIKPPINDQICQIAQERYLFCFPWFLFGNGNQIFRSKQKWRKLNLIEIETWEDDWQVDRTRLNIVWSKFLFSFLFAKEEFRKCLNRFWKSFWHLTYVQQS
jgi:hypothetical protein